ncbi:MAG: GWxTD domain-containing protein [Calditrichaeota bacterium]|nr:GWxTD domain-containing protein [Calditrichota bacterium]
MKKMILLVYLVLISGLFPSKILAQNKINLGLNVKQFRFNADTSLVEIYYGLLSGIHANQAKKSEYAFELTASAGKQDLFRNIWKVENHSDFNDSSGAKLKVDVLRYLLTPGKYDFQLIAKDLATPDRIDSVRIKNFIVRKNAENVTMMSDIELSREIAPASRAGAEKFVKNNFRVVPSVLNYYDLQNPNVYYYLEIYHVKQSFKGKYFYIKRTILDGQGLPVPSFPVFNKKKRIRGDDDIEVGMFGIQNLPSGKYNLHLAVADSSGHNIAARLVAFYVNNPTVQPENQANMSLEDQMAKSEIALVDVNDLDMLLGALKYLLAESERKIIDNINTEKGKRLYLFRYWKENDNNPDTNSLESFRDFIWRVQYANANFSDIRMKGWMSDRGRILITYGKPSEIQYYPNVPDFKEFQAWSYDEIENGVVFIFGVVGSFGDLKLLHSTKTGEVYNAGWLDLLKVSHGRTGIADETRGTNARDYMRRIFRDNNLEWPRYLK